MKNAQKVALIASLIHLSAYAVYNTASLRRVSEPNLVPWAIWGLMAVLNTATYRIQTGDKVMSMLSATGSLAAISTFFVALFMGGSFREIGTTNMIALVIGVIAVVVWKFGSPKYANYCVLTAVASGFVPFYIVLWKNPGAESGIAWLIWSISTTLGVVVVWMRSGKSTDYVAPAVSMMLHVTTFALTCM